MRPQDRLREVDEKRALITREVKVRNELRSQFVQRQARPRTSAERREQANIAEAIRQLDKGIRRDEGVSCDVLTPLEGKPGLVSLQAQLARLDDERRKLQEHVARWPAADATHLFRYTGIPYAATVDGRELEPGDVVHLNEAQAAAWADRFEPEATG